MTTETAVQGASAVMSETVTPRERVHAQIERRPTDRVPLAFWGSYYGPHDPLYRGILDFLGLPFEPERQFRKNRGHTVNFMDDRVLDALDVDTRYVWCGATDINSPDFSQVDRESDEDHEAEDLYGVGFRNTGYQVQVVPGRFPIHGGEDIDNYDLSAIETYEFPDPESICRLDELKVRAMDLHENTDYSVVARAPNSFGLFEQGCHLIGHENLYMAIALNKETVHLMTRRIKEFFLALYDLYLDAAGEYVDVVELPGDDYSGTGMSMVSPETFYEFFLEPWREIVALIRRKAPRAKILFHSDGNIMEFVRPFLDTGADIVNSIETDVGNDHQQLKEEFGGETCFWGALDVKTPLRKSIEATEREIENKMEIFKPGGGWVMAAENHTQRDIAPAHLIRAYEYARELGKY